MQPRILCPPRSTSRRASSGQHLHRGPHLRDRHQPCHSYRRTQRHHQLCRSIRGRKVRDGHPITPLGTCMWSYLQRTAPTLPHPTTRDGACSQAQSSHRRSWNLPISRMLDGKEIKTRQRRQLHSIFFGKSKSLSFLCNLYFNSRQAIRK